MKFKLYLNSPIGLTIKFEKRFFIIIPHLLNKSYRNLQKEYGKEWTNKYRKRVLQIEFMWLCFKFELEYLK